MAITVMKAFCTVRLTFDGLWADQVSGRRRTEFANLFVQIFASRQIQALGNHLCRFTLWYCSPDRMVLRLVIIVGMLGDDDTFNQASP